MNTTYRIRAQGDWFEAMISAGITVTVLSVGITYHGLNRNLFSVLWWVIPLPCVVLSALYITARLDGGILPFSRVSWLLFITAPACATLIHKRFGAWTVLFTVAVSILAVYIGPYGKPGTPLGDSENL